MTNSPSTPWVFRMTVRGSNRRFVLRSGIRYPLMQLEVMLPGTIVGVVLGADDGGGVVFVCLGLAEGEALGWIDGDREGGAVGLSVPPVSTTAVTAPPATSARMTATAASRPPPDHRGPRGPMAGGGGGPEPI